MSPRRNGLPTFAPSSVIVEFHEFAGRWFVTDRWGAGSGAAVKRPARKAALGKVVLSHIEAARSEWRQNRTQADDADLWAQFCANEAGVPVNRYLPEKRIVILAGHAGIQCHDTRHSPPVWEPLPDKSARALGTALIKRIGQLEPAPPTAESPEPQTAKSPAAKPPATGSPADERPVPHAVPDGCGDPAAPAPRGPRPRRHPHEPAG
jgi:hypothetical protein